eukprot:863985-Rhodomonas_salina.1
MRAGFAALRFCLPDCWDRDRQWGHLHWPIVQLGTEKSSQNSTGKPALEVKGQLVEHQHQHLES